MLQIHNNVFNHVQRTKSIITIQVYQKTSVQNIHNVINWYKII